MFRRFHPLLLCCVAFAQTPAGPQRVTLLVDRQEGTGRDKGAWQETNAATVFKAGDRVRFRIQANFSGYLYVMNHGTSGAYELLFPRSDTGSDNRMDAGKEYIVPAAQGPGGQGWFAIAGPPGYDTVYWLVSPVELGHNYRPLPPPPATSHLPSTLRPRCDDTVLKARGECLDDSAGVKPVAPGETLPENLSGIAGPTPRELLFMQDKGGVVLSSPQPLSGPVVYELRLAHR
jgi:hypothetical protein